MLGFGVWGLSQLLRVEALGCTDVSGGAQGLGFSLGGRCALIRNKRRLHDNHIIAVFSVTILIVT